MKKTKFRLIAYETAGIYDNFVFCYESSMVIDLHFFQIMRMSFRMSHFLDIRSEG